MFNFKNKPQRLPANLTSMIAAQQQLDKQNSLNRDGEKPQTKMITHEQAIKKLKKALSKNFRKVKFFQKEDTLFASMRMKYFLFPPFYTIESEVRMLIKNEQIAIDLEPDQKINLYALIYPVLVILFPPFLILVAPIILYQCLFLGTEKIDESLQDSLDIFYKMPD